MVDSVGARNIRETPTTTKVGRNAAGSWMERRTFQCSGIREYPSSKDTYRAPSPQLGLAPDYERLSHAVVVYTRPSLNWVRARLCGNAPALIHLTRILGGVVRNDGGTELWRNENGYRGETFGGLMTDTERNDLKGSDGIWKGLERKGKGTSRLYRVEGYRLCNSGRDDLQRSRSSRE